MNVGRKAVIAKLIILCLLILLPLKSTATIAEAPISAIVLEYGIYEDHGPQKKYTSPGTAAGTVSSGTMQQVRLLKQTQIVPLRKGIVFGYKWRMQGLTPGKSVNITYRIKHPPITNSQGIPMNKSEGMLKVTPKDEVHEMINAYQLSKDNELVPGVWTITTLLDDQIMAEMSFQVQ